MTNDEAQTLRRAEMTLRRWAEKECGDGSNWYIQRDEESDIPYEHYCGTIRMGPGNKDITPAPRRIPDKERGAIERVRKLCKTLGLHFYHQCDPRGCMLYVHTEPMNDQNYTNGVPCAA